MTYFENKISQKGHYSNLIGQKLIFTKPRNKNNPFSRIFSDIFFPNLKMQLIMSTIKIGALVSVRNKY